MKHNRYNLLLAIIFCAINVSIIAQNNTIAMGGEASSAEGFVSYSIGQIDYIEATGSGGTANLGLQQPIEIFVLGTDNFQNITLNAIVYPNPTSNIITLKVVNFNLDGLSFMLFDQTSRLLLEQAVLNENTTISLEQYATSIYHLTILNKNGLLKTFKIIKN